ncbi:iron ABC transporter permease [Cysteiniphilum sp. QT6929]|uniref:FecCD family ABC transporter permease n=1 Tax=Cysteiniphilum sp. QT6929 TaxID=2975055 RepID=UPI0024B344FB|nr:iron ABC transporter permease [Cysteiniphilum sp. QT6929]WHN66031.1 iron ABC transporter permease [Cysteiniphilum sp. QT6929]
MQTHNIAAKSLFTLQRQKYCFWFCVFMVLLIAACLLSLLFGALNLQFSQLFVDGSFMQKVALELRLPRLIATVVVGSALAVAGVVMQGLFRNPLADPALLGMTSGASLFAILFLLLSASLVQTSFLITWGLGLSAFVGSLVITFLTYLLSITKGRSNLGILVLAGVAINALCGALIGVMTYLSNDSILRSITFWSMGSFANITWGQVLFLLPCIFVAFMLLINTAKYLNAMIAGEQYARMLGVNIHRQKLKSIIAIALLVGASTAVAGPVAFIGLVVPHIIRFLIGNEHRHLLLFSCIFGGLLLTVADVVARVVLAPAELPTGLMTALIGAPYFVYLLFSQKLQRGV